MNTVDINTRVILIVGPSTTGKTTLANKIKNEYTGNGKVQIVSHDEIVSKMGLGSRIQAPSTETNQKFKIEYLSAIAKATANTENDLIIIDSLNYAALALNASLFLFLLLCGLPQNQITLIKTNPSDQLLSQYIQKRNVTEYQKQIILSQNQFYKGSDGSLNAHFSVANEYIIDDPECITFYFTTSKRVH